MPASGITPACAGTTLSFQQHIAVPQDHPRLRGNNAAKSGASRSDVGSPPLAREQLYSETVEDVDNGITPACAGTTRRCGHLVRAAEDHPRLRGNNQPVLSGWNNRRRITPACAGTTCRTRRPCFSGRDHPRLRGNNLFTASRNVAARGSPPLAREQLCGISSSLVLPGITPAFAGTT